MTKQLDSKNLTLKQRKWLEVYIKTGNATEAAMQAYDCKDRDSAKQIGYENLSKLDYQELLEEGGITDSNLLQTLRDGLVAGKVVSAVATGKDASAATTNFIDIPDHAVRHKYLETALKLKKRLGPDIVANTQINAGEMTIEFT